MTLAVGRSDVPELLARFDLLDGQSITAGPGSGYDWASPKEIEFSTELPGGFGPATVVLPRPDNWDPLQSALFGDSTIFDQQGNIAHEGRIVGLPHSGVNEITVEIEGWSKHLEDTATAKEIFVDMDMGKWSENPVPIRQYQASNSEWPGAVEHVPNQVTGNPELWQVANGSGTLKPGIYSTYHGPTGVDIGSVYYAWRLIGIDYTSTYAWQVDAFTDDSDSWPANYTTGDLSTSAGPGNGTLTVTNAGSRNATAGWKWTANPVSGWDTDYAIIWTQLVVYGRHGLTKRGSEDYTGHKGLYVSDMVNWVMDTYCPKVHAELGLGNIEATTYVVLHAVFGEDQTPRSIIESLLLLGGSTVEPLNWAIWEGKQFYMWSPSNRGSDWRVRSDTGGSSDDQGYDVQERPNGVKVSYNDGTSVPKSVGPTGSGADVEDDTYTLITDPNHPANLAGIDKWDVVDIGMNDQNGAEMLAQLYLAEKNRNEWRGAVTQRGPIKRDGGGPEPPYLVHAGDRVVVETDLDTRSRYITGTRYSTSSRTVSMTISPSAKRFDVLLARLQNAMTGIAQGSPHITPTAQSSGSSEPVDYGIPAQFEHMGR